MTGSEILLAHVPELQACSRRLPTPLAGLALAVIVTGLLTACGSRDTKLTVPTGAKPGDLTLEPCEFEAQEGAYEADCGALIVPENRGKSNSRLIALPITRVHATGSQLAEPVFWLEGGPGQSNMRFQPPPWLLAKHDVVMVGYRGADGSSVLDCPEVNQAVKGKGSDLLSAESRANVGEAVAQCAQRLQSEGVDLEGYTIPEVVEDMEAARVGLGYERVNLLSVSYGTRVAQIYAYLHPDSLYRSAMISVNPPGHFVWEPQTIDDQLEYYARLCAQDSRCSARTPDLAQTMRQVAHNTPRRWLFLPIDPGQVKMTTFLMLFQRSSAAMVFDTYIAAEQGDPSGLALMSLAYDFMLPAMTWGDLLAKGGSADHEPSRNYAEELNPADSILGSPMSLVIWGSAGKWPIHLIPDELRRVQTTEVETLLLSGSIDFSTPAEAATYELLPSLTHGQQVIASEMGHVGDVLTLQPAAAERLLTSFYDSGVADDSLYTYQPMDFTPPASFPMLAKIALGTALLILVVLAPAIRFIVRRTLRRTKSV